MPFTLTMPKLSPTMTEGHVAKWHKAPGDYIESGDLVLEISTDKATVEHNALDPGWLRVVLVTQGESAEVNAPLAIMSETKEEIVDPAAITTSPTIDGLKKIQGTSPTTPAATAVYDHTSSHEGAPTSQNSRSRLFISPLARKLAQKMGVSLENIQGSGPRGRIMSRDLPSIDASIRNSPEIQKSFIDQAAVQKEEERQAPLDNSSYIVTPAKSETLSQMRQVIAKRLQESKSTIPHFYASIDIDVRKLIALREELKASGFAITINDLIVKAVALALQEHPSVNATFDPQKNVVTYHPDSNISIAVSIDGGLITPIVAKAQNVPLATLSQQIKILAEKAKSGKLAPHEFMGGSFTISNLGMFGTKNFQAIINPPQVAILAVGAALAIPTLSQDGTIIAGKVMNITLSCDHRVVDGAEGAKFLKTLQELLQSPIILTVR